jgi:hypothetical protein
MILPGNRRTNMKPFPDLFQFKSGRNPELDAEVVPDREASKSPRHSARLFVVAVRAPNDQLHVVAIRSCGYEESSEPHPPSAAFATFVPKAMPIREKPPWWRAKAQGVGQAFLPRVAGVLAFFAKK